MVLFEGAKVSIFLKTTILGKLFAGGPQKKGGGKPRPYALPEL
jgi:hypothetical protein